MNNENEAEALRKAMRRAYHLGQIYWQQADSDSWTQNRKADETQTRFDALVHETIDTLLAHLHARPLPVGEVTQDAKARAAVYAPWFLFGAQAQELAAAIKEDGCCHHWKEVVKLLDEIAASPEKESALPVGEGKQSRGGA